MAHQFHRHVRLHHHGKHKVFSFSNATISTALETETDTIELATAVVTTSDSSHSTTFATTFGTTKTGFTHTVSEVTSAATSGTSTSVSPTAQGNQAHTPPPPADKSWRAVLVAGCVLAIAILVCLYAWWAIRRKDRMLKEKKEARRAAAAKASEGEKGDGRSAGTRGNGLCDKGSEKSSKKSGFDEKAEEARVMRMMQGLGDDGVKDV